jgi:hypothetical protein
MLSLIGVVVPPELGESGFAIVNLPGENGTSYEIDERWSYVSRSNSAEGPLPFVSWVIKSGSTRGGGIRFDRSESFFSIGGFSGEDWRWETKERRGSEGDAPSWSSSSALSLIGGPAS